MARGDHPRFGAIDFTVSVDVSKEFRAAVASVKKEDWHPVMRPVLDHAGKRNKMKPTGKEYALVVYEPSDLARKKDNPQLRFIAIREPRDRQLALPSVDATQPELPFPTIILDEKRYKLHRIVTNNWKRGASELVAWHWERCGKSEEVHAVLKSDLAGAHMPCGHFGGNPSWWAITVITFNPHIAMKRLVLGQLDEAWLPKRLKAVRFAFIGLAGRVVEHPRSCILRLADTGGAALCLKAREVIASLAGST